MKLTALIFAVFFLVLHAMPRCASMHVNGDCCQNEHAGPSDFLGNHHQDENHQEQDSSDAFCKCSCCRTITSFASYNAPYKPVAQQEYIHYVVDYRKFIYCSSFLQDIWQPPKVHIYIC